MFILVRRVIEWDTALLGPPPHEGALVEIKPQRAWRPNFEAGHAGVIRFKPMGARGYCVCEGVLFSHEQVELLTAHYELSLRERGHLVKDADRPSADADIERDFD